MPNIIKPSSSEHAVLSAPDASAGTLNKTDEKLELAGAELLRMEDEGGTPLTQEQIGKIRAYAKARKRIKSLLFSGERHRPDLKDTPE